MTPDPSGLTVWLTGLPSSGKTTLAKALAHVLAGEDRRVEVLDGDEMRATLGKGLGFSRQDRAESVRRTGFVAELLSRHGVVAVCALVSPYRGDRDEVRAGHGSRFLEVYVSTPADVCSVRGPEGRYARQRAGELGGLTGVDDPYEPPLHPDLVLPNHQQKVTASVEQLRRSLPDPVGASGRRSRKSTRKAK